MMQNSNTTPFHVLIVAAGRGARFGETIPKQYLKIGAKTVVRHTIERFLCMPVLQSIRVVIHPDDEGLYHDAVAGLNISEPVFGMNERYLSVYNGLKSFSNLNSEDIILIHDAARPCVSPLDIQSLLYSLSKNRAATLGHPIADTLRKADGMAIDRSGLWAIQTPQAFRYADILKAHDAAQKDHTHTDDASMVSAIGLEVALIEGSRRNIKITVKDDLELAAAFLSNEQETRTGMGFDVHAFDRLDASRKLILGGIEIPYDCGLKGHSDADVALHTITDALLGALGEGDIGQHFPPSNNAFKNMDSAVFLQKAHEMLLSKAGTLINVDLTIICEHPKITPYRDQMRARIADILQLDKSRINIKATTTEKLGFTGRGEGIAAQAVVNIRV